MLSERTKELLTAFVDGALTRRERKAVLRLLHGSSEARAFLRVLHENVHRLKQLPARSLPADFPSQVLRAIKDQNLRPTPVYPRPPRARRGMPRWAGVAVAASVMFLVAAGLIALLSHRDPSSAGLAKQEFPKNQSEAPVAENKPNATPLQLPVVEKPIFDSGSRLALADLNQKSFELARELKNKPGVHLNLTAKNDGKSLSRVEAAFQNSGIKLVIDPDAQVRIHKGEPVLVYAENVRPEELQSILRQLGKEDAQFPAVEVESFTSQDQNQLMTALGVSKKEYDTPPELFRQTMTQAPAPGNKNSPPREVKPAKPIEPERLAVALTPNASKSNEVKRFVTYRQSPQQGALRVLLVLTPE
jgi:hypothetical protein